MNLVKELRAFSTITTYTQAVFPFDKLRELPVLFIAGNTVRPTRLYRVFTMIPPEGGTTQAASIRILEVNHGRLFVIIAWRLARSRATLS